MHPYGLSADPIGVACQRLLEAIQSLNFAQTLPIAQRAEVERIAGVLRAETAALLPLMVPVPLAGHPPVPTITGTQPGWVNEVIQDLPPRPPRF